MGMPSRVGPVAILGLRAAMLCGMQRLSARWWPVSRGVGLFGSRQVGLALGRDGVILPPPGRGAGRRSPRFGERPLDRFPTSLLQQCETKIWWSNPMRGRSRALIRSGSACRCWNQGRQRCRTPDGQAQAVGRLRWSRPVCRPMQNCLTCTKLAMWPAPAESELRGERGRR
jgi:hypothetical protein